MYKVETFSYLNKNSRRALVISPLLTAIFTCTLPLLISSQLQAANSDVAVSSQLQGVNSGVAVSSQLQADSQLQVKDKSFATVQVQDFIQQMGAQHGYDTVKLNEWFAKIHPNQSILEKLNKPFEQVAWDQYRKNVVTLELIDGARNILSQKEKRAVLDQVSKKFKIPREVILAILGIETRYGAYLGNTLVLEALATCAFYYPRRAEFFLQELKEFLLLVQEHQLDPFKIFGSYAGAIGMAQFMPSSLRAYGKIQVDHHALKNDFAIAVYNVANYLRQHGWNGDDMNIVLRPKSVSGRKYLQLYDKLQNKPQPSLDEATLRKYGISVNSKRSKKYGTNITTNTNYALLVLNKGQQSESILLGCDNFFTITRYNKSVNYAMAVYTLADAIKHLKINFERS